jgi:hypothetical protein
MVRTIADANGNQVSIEVETAGDGLAEQVRAGICKDAIAQAVGRGRGVNRTETNPVEVHLVGTGLVEGLEVDELAEWQWLSKEAEAVALQGVWLQSTADMAGVIGMGRKTLEKARLRQKQMETFSYNGSLYGNVSIWSGVRYRRKIERHSWQEARFAPGAVDDPKAWLEARLGPVEVQDMEAVDYVAVADADQYTHARVSVAEQDFLEVCTSNADQRAHEAELPREHCRRNKPELPPDWRPRLAVIQREQCWSQEALADHIGLARPTWANFYGGRYDLGGEAMERLSNLLTEPPPPRQAGLAL